MARTSVARRIDAATLLLILYFSHTCSAKTESQQKYNARYRQNHSAEANSTSYPVNPYVFSAEDYDILQDAESLQQALSIVSYEPQKIDAKEAETGLDKSYHATEKAPQREATAPHRPNPKPKLPLEKKYFEVPRKQSRSRASDPEIASATALVAAKLPAEDPPYRQRSASTSLPVYAPLTERPALDANLARSSDNYPAATALDKPSKRKRSKPHRAAVVAEKPDMLDRLPRPFSMPTAQTPSLPFRLSSAAAASAEALVATTRSPATRRTRPTGKVGPPQTLSTIPPRLPQRKPVDSTLPTKLDQELQQTAPYATEYAHHFSQPEFPQTVSYTPATVRQHPVRQQQQQQQYSHTVPVRQQQQQVRRLQLPPLAYAQESQEQVVTFPPRKRNYVRRASTTEPAVPLRQEQLIVYNIPKRPSTTTQRPRVSVYSTASSREDHQTLPYGSVPVRPTRRDDQRARATLPSRRATPDVEADVPPPTDAPRRGSLSQPILVLPTADKDSREYVDAESNEYPTSQENLRDDDRDGDRDNERKQYSYSHVERYVEPLDDASSDSEQREASYDVVEDALDYPEPAAVSEKPATVLQRGALKRVDYGDSRADYDQAQGQNVQQPEVAVVAQHEPRGEEAADLVQEADHHHKKHHAPKKADHHEGGSEEHHEGEHHEHGEHGEKGYKEHHEHDEGEKGHHDKEKHDHHYDEKEGKDKESHEEAGFQEHHEKGEEGEKKAGYSEKGHHDKGHSTKGEHVVHKKDEFEKKTEFFDEFHEGGDLEKDGGHHSEHHHEKGGHHKKAHHHKGEHEKHHGEKGHHDKGHHHHEKKGHHEEEGDDHHHHHEERHGKKAGHADHKHWHHKKGDRR